MNSGIKNVQIKAGVNLRTGCGEELKMCSCRVSKNVVIQGNKQLRNDEPV